MKKKTIRRKVISGQIRLGIVLIILLSIVVTGFYFYSTMAESSDDAFQYARTAARLIDGDKVQEYYKTGKKDAYYEEILRYLNTVQDNTDILYYYVIVPLDEDIVYIWDADLNGDACELGQHEPYAKDGRETAKETYRKNPKENMKLIVEAPYGVLASAFSPIFNSEGRPVALVGVDISMPYIILWVLLFGVIVNFCIIAVILLSLVANVHYLNKGFIHPISVLRNMTSEIVDNLESEENITIDIHTEDELDDLARSFEIMHMDVKEYMNRLARVTAEKERIGAELEVATQIQAQMLPRIFPPFPSRNEFDIFATMTPAKEVGGDFYDFFLIDEDHLALVMADVSGKGVPAALFMVIAKTLIKNRAMMGGSPAEILADVNLQLCEGNDSDMFVTVWFAIISLSTGEGIAANAGHEYPVIKRKDGDFALIKNKHSMALASFEMIRFREHEFQLSPGDRLFVYTDGVPEASNESKEMFGSDRMLDSLNRRKEEDLQSLLYGMKEDIDSFVDHADQFDDITMLGFDYYGTRIPR